jgi:hypothetical protein
MEAMVCSKYCEIAAKSPVKLQLLLVETGKRNSQKTGNLLGLWKREISPIGRKIGARCINSNYGFIVGYMPRLPVCGKITNTGTIHPCRQCLVRYAGRQGIKSGFVQMQML